MTSARLFSSFVLCLSVVGSPKTVDSDGHVRRPFPACKVLGLESCESLANLFSCASCWNVCSPKIVDAAFHRAWSVCKRSALEESCKPRSRTFRSSAGSIQHFEADEDLCLPLGSLADSKDFRSVGYEERCSDGCSCDLGCFP